MNATPQHAAPVRIGLLGCGNVGASFAQLVEARSADIQRLYAATDADNAKYRFVHLPLTARDVVTSYGYRLGYKGSYVNFYVGNTVVLMPAYKDANDAVAKSILQNLYPGKTVVTIDVRNLYRNGGMVHCVTQQQPVAL